MTRRKKRLFLGDSVVRRHDSPVAGDTVERDGERYYRIAAFDAMPPFFMSVVSGHDHWLFVSSTGGLTCGRRNPETALFPYCTDDKIHDARETTGPKTALRVTRGDRTSLWRPFAGGPLLYDVERNLYKNVPGNKLVFEEINHDLGLSFSYGWTTGNRFGFIRESRLLNTSDEVGVELLDGLRNLLPYGVHRSSQSEFSTLVDGYKEAEAVPGMAAGLFTVSSILTDRAEPNEALKATVVWSTGLDETQILLSEDQVDAFCSGGEIRPESIRRGKRGAFFVRSTVTLPQEGELGWYLLADVDQGPSQTVGLIRAIRDGVPADAIERDIAEGTRRLEVLAAAADGFQKSADALITGRHFSNTLFNIMRGGVFPHGYVISRDDFLDFVRTWNRPQAGTIEAALASLDDPLTLDSLRALADGSGNADFSRWVDEYLPLCFSRRHGDPSRPWNHFSINLTNADGSERLDYQGNWRDIFQNWEALALSFPEYIESFIAKFVNASTADGHNPYRISRDGIDWEVLAQGDPWSNIGYWGDHQVAYLLRLLELSRDYHPGLLEKSLSRDRFTYADVPYRIKPYADLVRDPRNGVAFDDDRARAVEARVAGLGADGRLAALPDGSIYHVNLLEKLLVPALAKIGSLVPGGGIWMNTQRPEWNDANNALVGYGLSMVTLCYLRRYLRFLDGLLGASAATSFDLSEEVALFLKDARGVLETHRGILDGPVEAAARKAFLDGMGAAGERYRARVYAGPRGAKTSLASEGIREFVGNVLSFLDHSIAHARREDGLFHAYNLIRLDEDGYEVEALDEMLEGQVAALSSGYLDGEAALSVLDALRASRLYRSDQNSYTLYPDRRLPSFLERNVIPAGLIEGNDWIRRELESGNSRYVERDVEGRLHFNAAFRNGNVLRAGLTDDPAVDPEDADRLCEIYESVFEHRRFTGRSGSMYKYEGLGCIYWHMVSKLLLATAEITETAAESGAGARVVDRLAASFRNIRDGIGVHKTPSEYGAFPVDPYSHTPGFAGVQQPGLTGQVKEDVIARFRQLGVRVVRGQVIFAPVLLDRDEFLRESASWRYPADGGFRTEELSAGSLAFTLCGVPVVYRIGKAARLQVFSDANPPSEIPGNRLGETLSRSLFRREGRIAKLVVDIPEATLR